METVKWREWRNVYDSPRALSSERLEEPTHTSWTVTFNPPLMLTKWAVPGNLSTIHIMTRHLCDIRFFNSIVRDIVVDKYQSGNRIPSNLRVLETEA